MSLRFRFMAAASAAFASCAVVAWASFFEPLFTVTDVVGDAVIYKPGSSTPETVVENHAYPYGSRIILSEHETKTKTRKDVLVRSPEVSFSLSRDHMFKIAPGTEVTVSHGDDGDMDKKVLNVIKGKLASFVTISTVKTGGEIDTLTETLQEALVVRTPLADCRRLIQRTEVGVQREGDNYKCVISSSDGTMEVIMPQFRVEETRRKSSMEIFGNKDFTRVTRLAGDFEGKVARGSDPDQVVEFKTRSVLKIWRSYARLGGKMAVAVMLSHPDGTLTSYAFLDGEPAVVDSAVSSVRPGFTDKESDDDGLEGVFIEGDDFSTGDSFFDTSTGEDTDVEPVDFGFGNFGF
jgi:hypothetical protein